MLPEYTVRVSARSRRARLVVSPRDGLVLVVPARWRGDPDALVAQKRAWAETALAAVAERRARYLAGPEALLPDIVSLRSFGETWPVEYRETAAVSVRARLEGGTLVLSGGVSDADACVGGLTRWLHRTAHDRLLPLLDVVAAESGITYAGARVRRQKTRWGSCSARKTISLNRNLIFLPEHLVRSLMLHELAHTLVLDHSARFWTTLERHDPNAQEHRRQMRAAGNLVPEWADV
jgi:hypothetical protein